MLAARQHAKRTNVLVGWLLAGTLPTVALVALLAWKHSYYGDILPATFHTKAAGAASHSGDVSGFFSEGLDYLLGYWLSYGLFLLVALAAAGWWMVRDRGRGWRRRRVVVMVTLASVVAYQAYMLRTGGDYYEFRILSPQTPLLMLLLAPGIAALRLPLVALALAIALGSSVWHVHNSGPWAVANSVLAQQDELDNPSGVLNRRGQLEPIHRLMGIGTGLHKLFGHLGDYPEAVRVATVGMGAKGYFSRLRMVEMHGLNDRRVSAADPDMLFYFPGAVIGHRLVAKPMLLAEMGVNLIVWVHPFRTAVLDFEHTPFEVDKVGDPRMRWAIATTQANLATPFVLPPTSKLLSLPLGNGWSVPALYIVPNDTIDEALAKHGIEQVQVFRDN